MRTAVAVFLAATLGFVAASTGPILAQNTSGGAVHCVPAPFDASCDDFYLTIQDAVDNSNPGDTVFVAPGTYAEQVVITKPLTLEGSGAAQTSVRPATVSSNTTNLFSGDLIAAIVLVVGTTDVTVADLTVDGTAAGLTIPGCSPGYVGIFYRASSGVVANTRVTGILLGPTLHGCQAVLGMFVQSGNGGPGLNSKVAIINNAVDLYGKNGITANEAGTFVTVMNNTVTGRGPTGPGDAAQNGVQIGFGARGLVSGNTISNNFYLPADFVACGLLFFHAGGGLGRTKSNTYLANEQDTCTGGVGPSANSPFN